MDIFLQDLNNSLALFKPEIALTITLVLAVFADVIFKKQKLVTGYLSIIGYLVTAFLLISDGIVASSMTFTNSLAIDPLSQFFKVLILAGAIITTMMTFNSKELLKSENSIGEYYILLIGMTIGMFLLASANNLIMIYIAFETMSICSYVLAGYTKEIRRASEASLKYVIYGSLASGIMIYGMSILFGLTGTLDLAAINTALVNNSSSQLPLITAGLMIFAGIAYKISAVPFHYWTPDVYEGSPVATTALLSVSSKAAGFAVLIRFLKAGFIDPSASPNDDIWTTLSNFDWSYVIAIIAVITMTVGNLLAIWQENIKRMLAYSSIAHAGYMLMGVMVMNTAGIAGILFYFVTYLLMNFGAFYVVQIIANKIDSEDMNDYNGLVYKNPFVAVAMILFLVSLMGMPPFAGFLAKYYLFTSVIEAGYVGIAIIAVLNSVVSVFYYAKVIRNMCLRGDMETNERVAVSKGSIIFLYIMVIPVVFLIINFKPLLEWVKYSAIMIIR